MRRRDGVHRTPPASSYKETVGMLAYLSHDS
jgi:hypothetical protein